MAIKKNQLALSFAGIPKNALHNILHKLIMQQSQAAAHQNVVPFKQRTTNNGQLRVSQNHFLLFQYHKNYCLLSRLKSKALCLLNTQYAKKPKNPT